MTSRNKQAAYAIEDARYAKDRKLVKVATQADHLKTRAERLAEVLGERYTHREHGFVMTPARAGLFERLYGHGWDASTILGKLTPPADRCPSFDPFALIANSRGRCVKRKHAGENHAFLSTVARREARP